MKFISDKYYEKNIDMYYEKNQILPRFYQIYFQDGLLDRSWVAGVLPTEVMLSHIFTQFIVLLGQITITLVFVFLVFKIPCNGPVGWIVVIAILQGFAGMCYGKIICYCVYVKNQTIFNY